MGSCEEKKLIKMQLMGLPPTSACFVLMVYFMKWQSWVLWTKNASQTQIKSHASLQIKNKVKWLSRCVYAAYTLCQSPTTFYLNYSTSCLLPRSLECTLLNWLCSRWEGKIANKVNSQSFFTNLLRYCASRKRDMWNSCWKVLLNNYVSLLA